EAPPTLRQPPPAELTLDIGALERAAAVAQSSSPSFRSASELPPPPANLFRDKGGGTGKYRFTPAPPPIEAGGASAVAGAQRAPAVSAAAASGAPSPATSKKPATPAAPPVQPERRYAPTRPAAIFGQARPQP